MSGTTKKHAKPTAYAELQVTTNFSFLRGGSHPQELVAQAKALGLSALAVTDHNTLAGVVRAHSAANVVGLKLIVGARLDLQDAPSLLCLPTDRQAYGRLCRLLSLGQRRAEKGQCTLFLEDVAAHAEGQIFIALPPAEWSWREVTVEPGGSDAPAGAEIIRFAPRHGGVMRPHSPSPRPADGERVGVRGGHKHPRSQHPPLTLTVRAGDPSTGRIADPPEPPQTGRGEHEANPASVTFEAQLRRLKAMLDAPLYLAASHLYRGDDRARTAALGRLAGRCGTPLVATNDVLYHAPHRRPLQDVLTCIRESTTIHTAGLRLAANAERHLKSPSEMARLFKGFEAALARTGEIAAACRFSLDQLVYEYPDEPVPSGKTAQSHLEDLTWEGARWRFPDGIPDKVAATLERELALISQLQYAPYFLTVHDIVNFARSRGILCQGRGSAANSVVCYCLSITAVNPTEIDLLFERFVSPERKEPPDIDVDFEHERREEVIQYIYARYGRDRAALAATVISYRARSAVREVGKAMGLSQDTVAALAGMVWGTRSGGALPRQFVREAGLDPKDPLLATVLELADELTGFPRHLSQHVGGFVLTRGPLSEVVPIGNAAMEDRTVIEWDKDDLEAVGLLKVDVLALGMLTCIRRAFGLLEARYGRRLTLATVPREDPAVYDMLCRADSIGVFQVESRAQMNMLPRLKPRTFYDLVIEVAIVRPGPIQGDMVHPYLRRRSGLEPETYPSPHADHGPPDELRQVLGKTKGVPLFQEQAMRIAMVAAGFSDAEVNELRRAMATFRHKGTIGLLEDKMVTRMVARGYYPEFATRCFNQIKGFGEYGFPESHAASFAHLVYVSSWLKRHYPAAFACALLNSQPMGFYAPAQIVRDAREHGVEVRPVDVNLSDWDCTLEPGGQNGGPALRLGLRQVDGLGEEEASKIVAARGPAGGSLSPLFGGGSDGSAIRPVNGSPARTVRVSQTTAGRDDRIATESEPIGSLQGEVGASVRPSPRPSPRQAESLTGRGGASAPPRFPFREVHELWRRARVRLATLERLAAADAFRSMGLDRRQALWEVRALVPAEPLPLFAWNEAREAGPEPAVELPEMPLSEHVVNDYQTLRLSLKAHPLSFLRPRLEAARAVTCAELRRLADGAWVAVAGVVLVRQRPGSANGVVFMTLEDETGVANTVVWANTLERFRKAVMTARLVLVRGRIQRHEDIIHIVSRSLEDKSQWLVELSESALDLTPPAASANPASSGAAAGQPKESPHPEPGCRRAHLAPAAPRHPRNERILPKSRDFH